MHSPEDHLVRLREALRAALAGDEESLLGVLRVALSSDPASRDGKTARRAAARAYQRRARALLSEAERASGSVAADLRRRANEALFLAILARHFPGSSGPSEPSVPAVDPKPDAPTNVTATAGNAQATVNWTKPYDGGSPILSYLVNVRNVATSTTSPWPVPGPNPPIQTTVTGLTNNQVYAFTVQALNIEGASNPSVESNHVTPTTGGTVPAAPASVTAILSGSAVVVSWPQVPDPPGFPVLAYEAKVYDQNLNPTAIPPRLFTATQQRTTTYLLPPATYRFGVRAQNAIGFGQERYSGPVLVPSASLTPFKPPLFGVLPPPDPVLIFDERVTAFRRGTRLLGEARTAGTKWRFEYLKAQAEKAAGQAMAYEGYIAQLMSMAVQKVGTAEQLLSPILDEVLNILRGDVQQLQSLTASPGVAAAVDRLGRAASQALLLEAILTWLIQNEPLTFWAGLFNALIGDIAGLDSGLSRTGAYLDATFLNAGPGTLGAAVRDLAADLDRRVAGEVDRVAAPLHAAVAELIGGTSRALRTVFESLDAPVMMTPSGVSGTPDVPNVNPLASLTGQLQQTVQALVDAVKAAMRNVLLPIANLGVVFREVLIAYLVLPLLAFLVISIAGGPLSAAVLAAIVLVAAQELVHLLARWLSGPLLAELDRLKRQVLHTVGQLEALFSQHAASLVNPSANLELLAGELLELKNLLPEVFLSDAAALLEDARLSVLRSAIQLGLSAEQALGWENATAFDAVGFGYDTQLAPAPQLPGGSDVRRLAGAALLRDLDLLERRRTDVRDGKEVEVTHRLSLFRLFGGVKDLATGAVVAAGELKRLLTDGKMLIHLDHAALVDRSFPGLYRALIKEIRLLGVFEVGAAALGTRLLSTLGIPITVTHLGSSRTRIKRDANPAAPPSSLPSCFPPTPTDLRTQLVARLPVLVEEALTKALSVYQDPKWRFDLWTLKIVAVGPGTTEQIRGALEGSLVDAIGRAVVDLSCGLVDPSSIRERARTLLRGMTWSVECTYSPGWWTYPVRCSDTFIRSTVTGLNLPGVLGTGLAQTIEAAWATAARPITERIGKWGPVVIEEDPDPQVRALGFAMIRREAPPESAVFNLFPSDPGLPDRSAIVPVTSPLGQLPVTPIGTLQYAPFENRGIEGDLLIAAEPGRGTDLLTDLIVEVTMRGCYDEALAATVRAAREHDELEMGLADAVAATKGRQIVFPGEMAELRDGSTAVRTFHFSLRSHRDKVLRAALAAAQALAAPAPAPNPAQVGTLQFNSTLRPLRTSDAFIPLNTGQVRIGLQFQRTRPTNFGDLLETIPVTPEELGFPAMLVSSTSAELVALGIAVIPTRNGVTQGATVTTTIPSLLQPLLPGMGATDRLAMTTFIPSPTQVVRMTSLWNAPLAPRLDVQFQQALTQGLIYDVIFSVSLRVPVTETQTVVGALR